MTDLIIIGSGPAGVSAAIYASRAGISVLVVSNGRGALGKADMIGNYYGFPGPVSAEKLYDDSIINAKSLGAVFADDEIVGASFDSGYRLTGTRGVYESRSLIIATGSSRKTPDIPGLSSLAGHGVSYCAVCDAFFFRGKKVFVLGSGSFALHEAEYLSHIASAVTVLSNGRDFDSELPASVSLDRRKINAVLGESAVSGISFEGGTTVDADGIFIAEGVAGSDALAKTLGALTENGRIRVDDDMKTSIPGLFAAGDCTGGLLQVCKAVSDGAKAAASAIAFIRKQ